MRGKLILGASEERIKTLIKWAFNEHKAGYLKEGFLSITHEGEVFWTVKPDEYRDKVAVHINKIDFQTTPSCCWDNVILNLKEIGGINDNKYPESRLYKRQ